MQPHQVRTQTFFIFAASFSHNFHVISIHVRGRVTVLLIKHYLLMWLLIIKKRERRASHTALGFQPATPSAARPSASCLFLLSLRLWWDILSPAQSCEGRLSLTRRFGLAVSAAKTVPFNIVLSSSMLRWHSHTHTHTDMRACSHRCTLQKMSSANCSSVRLVGIGLFSQWRWDRLWHFLYLLSYIWAFDIFINYSVTYYQLNYYLWYL